MFEKALELIRNHKRIIIHRHSNPDGDAIGSQVGLKKIIEASFPEKEVYIVGDDPKRYSCVKDSRPDDIPDSYYEGALAVILDTSAKALIADKRYVSAKDTLRIDHHLFCEKIADTEIVDQSFESCSSLIAYFARESNLTLTPDAAKALYTGMVTDSGRFRYDSTTSRTFSLASFLVEKGFPISDVYSELYSEKFENILLKAKFILKIRFTKKNVAYIFTSKSEISEMDADPFIISRSMVGTMADIKGVDVWANFTETDSVVLAEIRSSKYNINPIAVKYGGGGHQKASGATLKDFEEAEKLLGDLDLLIQ